MRSEENVLLTDDMNGWVGMRWESIGKNGWSIQRSKNEWEWWLMNVIFT